MTKRRKNSQILELTPAQQQAIPLILAGKSDREVGEAVGFARETVWTWRRKDPQFIAALNKQRCDLWDSARGKLLGLAGKAVDVIEQNLDNGDLRAALSVIKMIGMEAEPEDEEFNTDTNSILMGVLMEQTEQEEMHKKRLAIGMVDPERNGPLPYSQKEKNFIRACQKYHEQNPETQTA